MYVAHNVTGYDKGSCADDDGGDVDYGNLDPWECYGNVTEVVAYGVEGAKMGVVLEYEE